MTRIHPVFVLILLMAAHPAAAQGRIDVGATVTGELSAGDPTSAAGAHHDDWTFQASLGERYRVTLRSDDFDAYLRVGPPGRDGCAPCERDDDGAGGTDAMVEMVARAHGPHVIRVTSFRGGETGRYTLHLEQDDPGAMADTTVWVVPEPDSTDYGVDTVSAPVVVDSLPVHVAYPSGEARYLTARVPEEGRLDDRSDMGGDGAYHDVWLYSGRRGETVTFALESDDFDTYLRVRALSPVDSRWRELASDDDGGTGTNSELTVTLPDQAVYEVHAAAYRPGARGRYTLTATVRAAGEEQVVLPRLIGPGPAQASELTKFHPRGANGAPVEVWEFGGLAGWEVTIDMRSDDFDTVLRVLDARGGGPPVELARDDDGGDGTNSRVVMKLPRTGGYLLHAGAYGTDAAGWYTLELRSPREEAPPPRPQRPARHTDAPTPAYHTLTAGADTTQGLAEPIGAGPRATGELHPTDRRALRGLAYFDVWSYRARAGETVRVRMGSDVFDTEVRVGRWVDGRWDELARDDDGGTGTDSELTLRFPADGVYEIHAHARFADDVGPYWLQVERR